MKLLILLVFSTFVISFSNDKQLTEQEINDCKTFVDLKGQDRYEEREKIDHLLPSIEFPNTKITTKAELEKYFGEPDKIRDDGVFVYILNGPDKSTCTFILTFNDNGLITFTGLENCNDF